MGMVVRTNINSMNANRNLSKNNNLVAKSIEKLSSGYAINRAADDASGLAVSEKMRAQISGLDQGTSNTSEGISLVQTAEGALNEIHNMLNRAVELATKSANGTICDEVDREAIQAEIDVLVSEIDRIAQSTNFNGIPLLSGMDTNTLIDTEYFDGILTDAQNLTFFNISSGITSTSAEYNSTISYISDTFTLAPGATSVPAGSTLPYRIEMEVVAYNETNSTDGTGSIIEKKNIYLEVTSTGVIGSNGTSTIDFTNLVELSEWDKANSSDPNATGYPYVSNPPVVTENEMQIIMEKLLNNQSYDLNTGGSPAYYSPSEADGPHFYLDSDGVQQELQFYTNGTPNYPTVNGNKLSATHFVPAKTHYTVTSDYSNDLYDSSMNIYGGSGYTNSGRVLGVVSTVSQGGIPTGQTQNPNPFDPDAWSSGVDVNNQPPGTFLGITSLGESPRNETKIPEPVTQADIDLLTPEEIADLVVTIEKVVTKYPDSSEYSDFPKYPNYPYDGVTVTETKKYVTVINPFTDTTPSMFGDDVEIIYGDPSEPEHYVIDKLCEKISQDFTLVDTDIDGSDNDLTDDDIIEDGATENPLRVTRKVDDLKYDVPTDANYTNMYTIQMGQFYQTEYSWNPEPTKEETWEILKDPIILQVADQNEEYNRIGIYIQSMRVGDMGIDGLDVSTEKAASDAIEIIKDAINYVSTNRGSLGADQNRLEHTVNNNNNTSENMTSARSVIKDTDMAKEMMEYTKMNVLTQSAQSMLAQSNQSMEQVLSLLG